MGKKKQRTLFKTPPPDTNLYEKRLKEKGFQYIAGVDEVGRGCLAGPVLAAAAILPFPCKIKGITDSKKISPKKRDELYDEIFDEAISIGFGIVEHSEIDKINILQASLKAMQLAIESLSINPDYVLVDGSYSVPISIPQVTITKGDFKSITIGAASIVAKVKRDRMMSELEKLHPGFSFSVHKGYGTKAHFEELKKQGPSPIHRMTFRGVK